MSKNKIQVPEAKQAMEQFKMEAANEVPSGFHYPPFTDVR